MATKNFCDCCDGEITDGNGGDYGRLIIEQPEPDVDDLELDMVCVRCLRAAREWIRARKDKAA